MRNHVENCRGNQGSCLDNYMLWLEKYAREELREKNISEDGLPGLIRNIDLCILDLIGF